MNIFKGYQRGVNLGGWLSQCVSYEKEHFDNFITEVDIEKIASWGLDHVRLPLDYDVIETDEGTLKEDGFAHIDDCISWCRKYGLNLILDVHKAYGFMFDTKEVPDPDKFFTDIRLQDRFISTWTNLIKRYGKDKDIVAFELLNEVVNPDFADKWNEIADRAISLIREYEKDAYIIIGGVAHNNVLSVPKLNPPRDEYIIYNFHCYEPLCFTHQHAHWVENIDYDLDYPAPLELYKEKSILLNQAHAGAIFEQGTNTVGTEFFEVFFSDAVEYAKKYNVPLYCGEYGVIDKAPLDASLRWLCDISKAFDKFGIGRAIWNYKNKDFGIVDEHFAPKQKELINILVKSTPND